MVVIAKDVKLKLKKKKKDSTYSTSNSDPRDLGLTEKVDVRLPIHVLYSPLSPGFTSKAIASTWRMSSPESMFPYSATLL